MVGRPRTTGRAGAFEVPTDHEPTRMIRTTFGDDADSSTRVVLLVREGSASTLRRRGAVAGGEGPSEDGWDRIELSVRSVPALVEEISAAGPDVRVVEPPQVREAVVRSLTAVLDAHGGGR